MQLPVLSRKLEGISNLRSLSWKAVCGESRLPRLEGEQGYSLWESPALPSSTSQNKTPPEAGLFASLTLCGKWCASQLSVRSVLHQDWNC